jgi:hypothetical protein
LFPEDVIENRWVGSRFDRDVEDVIDDILKAAGILRAAYRVPKQLDTATRFKKKRKESQLALWVKVRNKK